MHNSEPLSDPHHVPSRCPVGKAGHTACSEKVASGDFLLRSSLKAAYEQRHRRADDLKNQRGYHRDIFGDYCKNNNNIC